MAKEEVLKETRIERYQRIALILWIILGIASAVFLTFFLIYRFRPIFSLLLYTLAIVYVLRPVVDFFEKRKIPRALSVLLTYLLVLLALVLLAFYFIPIVIDQVRDFIAQYPRYVKTVAKLSSGYLERLEKLRVPAEANKLLEQGLISLKNILIKLVSKIPGITLNLFSAFLYFLLAPVIAFYILKDLRPIKETLIKLVPKKHEIEARTIMKKIDKVVGGFLKGQLIVSLIVGILASIGLAIIGVNFPVLIGMVTGVLNIIPYFGPIAGAILAALVAFFESPLLALGAVLVLLTIQQIDGLFISPNVVGSQVNLHPAVVIFSLLIGGALLGVMGMILAIPLAASLKALVVHFQEKTP